MSPPAVENTTSVQRRFGGWPLLALAALVVLAAGGALLWNPGMDARAQETTGDASPAVADSTAESQRVVVYYFHTTYRCVSCRNIEKYTREAIESGFPAELEDGFVVWRVVNVEDEGNEHFVKDYQLFTKSVVLVDERSGKWKNLPKVWQLLGDPNDFIRYIQTETRAFLGEKGS